jgi:hypothetical protein
MIFKKNGFCVYGLFLLAFGFILTGCSTKESSPAPTPPNPTPPEPTETWYVCDGSPSTCLKLASGWTLVGEVIEDVFFNATSGLLLPDGRIRLYGEYDPDPMDWSSPITLESYISSDGVKFYHETGIRYTEGGAPNVIHLDSGDYRMYLSNMICTDGNPKLFFISAISSNGLDFVLEPGDRLVSIYSGNEATGFAAPRVVRLKDGTYRMYYIGDSQPGNMLLSAVSKDGLKWEREDGVRIYGNQFCSEKLSLGGFGPLIDKTGKVRVYCPLLKCDSEGKNDHFGIFEFTSSDGLSFTWNSTPVVEGYYITSRFNDKETDPRLFPNEVHGVITPDGLRLYFRLTEEPGTATPIWQQGVYCVLNSSIK